MKGDQAKCLDLPQDLKTIKMRVFQGNQGTYIQSMELVSFKNKKVKLEFANSDKEISEFHLHPGE